MTSSKLYRILIFAGVALTLCVGARAGASDEFVSGLINVQQWNQAARVSNELGDSIYPGERLKITLSGQADINWSSRWEENCFLGICKRKEWIDHNWQTPSTWPVEFELIDDNNMSVYSFSSTTNGTAEFLVPADDISVFNRRLRLYAKFVSSIPAIDTNRSQGQYSARIEVTAVERLRALSRFLVETKPSPTSAALKNAWVNDVFFVDQNRAEIAKWLVQHAQNSFPVATQASEHQALLEYASELDPTGSTVGFAIASMYLEQGNPNAAEAALTKVIKQLQQAPNADDPLTQLSLGAAHLRLASTIELGRGYADRHDLADISTQYSAALDIATQQHAPALAVDALFGRAKSTRARNTLASLQSAETDFRKARDLSPVRIAGLALSVAPGDQQILVAKHPQKTLVGWKSLTDDGQTSIHVQSGDSFLQPLAVTANGRVLSATTTTVGWINLADPNPGFDAVASLPSTVIHGITNGSSSLLWMAQSDLSIPPSIYLLREGGQPRAVLMDGKSPGNAAIASSADRYLVVATPPTQFGPGMPVGPGGVPTVAVELRQVGVNSDSVVRRVQAPWIHVEPYRLSQDGKLFAVLIDELGPQGPKRKLLVWDDQATSSPVEISVPFSMRAPNGLAFAGFGTQPPLGADSVTSFDFTPDGNLIFGTQSGAVLTAAISANAPLQPLVIPAAAAPSNSWGAANVVTASKDLVVVSGLDEQGRYEQFIEWPTKRVTLARDTMAVGPFGDASGYWRSAQGRVGSVQILPAPLEVQSVNSITGATIGQDVVSSGEFTQLRLLPGGRYLCLSGSGLKVRDLVTHSEKVLSQPGLAGPSAEGLSCVPNLDSDGWTLISQRQNALIRATKYRGLEKDGTELTLTVPDDFIQLEKDAAKRMNFPYVEPAFGLQQLRTPLGSMTPERDGRMLAYVYPTAAVAEAMKTPAVAKWISLPYVLLQEPTLQIRRARLPLGAMPLKILPSPIDKIVYAWNGKILWKPLNTDADGIALMDLPPPVPFAPNLESMPPTWNFIQVNPAGTRMVLASMNIDFKGGRAVTQQKFFDISDGSMNAVACTPCVNQSFNTRALVDDKPLYGPAQWGNVQVDLALDNMILYSDDYAAIYNVGRRSIVGALPPRQVIWVAPQRAQYMSGPNDTAMVSF